MAGLPKGLLKKVIEEGYDPPEAMKEAWRRVKLQQKRYATRMSYGGGYPLGYIGRNKPRKRKPHKIPFNQWLKAVEREFDLAGVHPKWSGFTAKKLYKVYTPKKAAEKLILESKRRKNPIAIYNPRKGRKRKSKGEVFNLQKNAIAIAEKNLASGVWNVRTAQLWLKMVDEQPEDILKATKNSKNPIAIYNPPTQQKLLYGRAYIPVIRGIKTNGRYKGERYQHNFSKSNEVSIYGNPDGSITVKSNNNLRLWDYDKDI